MRVIARSILFSMVISIFPLIPNTAHASCADYPESVTDVCIAENLAAEQARQAAYAAKQAADAAAVQAAADAQKAQQAADEAARAAAAQGLPADSCGRPENSSSTKCTQERLNAALAQANADAATQQSAQSSAEIEQRKAWGIYDPALGDCTQTPNSMSPGCIAQNLAAEQHRQADQTAKASAEAQRVIDSATAQSSQQNLAEIAKRKAWGIYDPALGDCSQPPASLTKGCLAQNLVAEKFRAADYARTQANAASAATKKAALAKAAQALAAAKSQAKLLALNTKKITITCIKGSLTKIISDAEPKCPSGFKKK